MSESLLTARVSATRPFIGLAAKGGCTCIQHEALVRYRSPQQLEQDRIERVLSTASSQPGLRSPHDCVIAPRYAEYQRIDIHFLLWPLLPLPLLTCASFIQYLCMSDNPNMPYQSTLDGPVSRDLSSVSRSERGACTYLEHRVPASNFCEVSFCSI